MVDAFYLYILVEESIHNFMNFIKIIETDGN